MIIRTAKKNDGSRVSNHNEDGAHVVGASIAQDTIRETQAQASGSLVSYFDNLRLHALLEKYAELQARNESATMETARVAQDIRHLIESNRGAATGMHGFIGERIQVAFSNAESLMQGQDCLYDLIDDNGIIDYWKGNVPVQQKACMSDKVLGLKHVLKHAQKYPEFVEDGGIYQIPKDFYETYRRFVNMPKEIAFKLRKEDLRLWKAIQKFNEEAPDIKIEPMTATYDEIQAGTVSETINNEQHKLDKMYRDQKEAARQSCSATFKEGLKVAGISAALEGVTGAGISVIEHAQSKNVLEFDKNDWKEIAVDGAKGSAKGAIRGAAVYAATNVANIPAPVATAGVTVAFGVVSDGKKLCDGEMTTPEFALKTVERSADAAVTVLSAKAGEKLIPIPIVGSLVGGAVGSFVWNVCKSELKHELQSAG